MLGENISYAMNFLAIQVFPIFRLMDYRPYAAYLMNEHGFMGVNIIERVQQIETPSL